MMSRITLNIRRRMNISQMTHDSVPREELFQMPRARMSNRDQMFKDIWQVQELTEAVIDISPHARASEGTVGYEAGAMTLL